MTYITLTLLGDDEPMLRLTPPCQSAAASESGFTLLEIIAVMVIMSILAVVAVPKYFDLQEKAKEKAMQTGKAEAIGRVNSYFASEVLDGVVPGSIVYSEANLGTNVGDFFLTVTNGGNSGDTGSIVILITGRDGTAVAGQTTTATIPRPGFD